MNQHEKTERLQDLAMNMCEFHSRDRRGFKDECGYCRAALTNLECAYAIGAEDVASLRMRAVAAEHHRALELLSKGSAVEQIERELRIKLAETEVRAEAAEAQLASQASSFTAVSGCEGRVFRAHSLRTCDGK